MKNPRKFKNDLGQYLQMQFSACDKLLASIATEQRIVPSLVYA
jgi:hypothetical protein